ncbi:ubiquitin-protein ligase [Martiniozyma asiatica (nom. inval.)]|nr:ubiquitin-protein ligase [Martiniozyma asiatica]
MSFGSQDYTGLGTNGFEVSLGYLTGVPDINTLTCSNDLKLAFKSLQKRDATTREKSIVDLYKYVSDNSDEINNDLILITWVQMYAKLSLDDSKKVRSVSHQIQSKFVSSLGKKYIKYLRDTIGIWLSGCYDSDRSTSKACKLSVNEAFGNSTEKVNNLWKAFITQILFYSHQIFLKESIDTLSDDRFVSKDDALAKWTRAKLASTMIITKVITEIETIDLNENVAKLLKEIFDSEYFQICFSDNDFQVKKNIYQSFKTLIISKHKDQILNKKLYKHLTKSMVKGLKIDRKKNSVLYGNVILSILDTLITATRYDSSFWCESKKALDRLSELLHLGSVNSDPLYYDLMVKLLTLLPVDFISWKEYSNSETYARGLITSIESEKMIPFIERGWCCLIAFANFTLKQLSEEDGNKFIIIITESFLKLLDSRTLNKSLVQSLHKIFEISTDDKDILLDINACIMDALPNREIEIEIDDFKYKIKNLSWFLENFINVLFVNKSDLTEVMIADAIDALDDETDDEDKENPTLSFKIIDIYLQQNKIEFSEVIQNFIQNLDKFITDSFMELPLQVLQDYSLSAFCTFESMEKILDLLFIKFQNLNETDELIRILPKLKNFNIHNTNHLSQFLISDSNRSKSPESNNDSDVIYQFLTKEILENLFKTEELKSFYKNSLKYYKSDVFVDFSINNKTFISNLFETLQDSSLYELSSELLSKLELELKNEEFRKVYVGNLINSITLNNYSLFKERISNLEVVISELKTFDLREWIINALISTPTPSIELVSSNSLGNGIFLFGDLSEKLNVVDALNKLALPLFLSHVSKNVLEESQLIDFALFGELASDVVFVGQKISNNTDREFIDFQVIVDKNILKVFSYLSLNDIINALDMGSSNINVLNRLVENLNDESNILAYYSNRILKKILSDKCENITNSEFEDAGLMKIKNTRQLYTLVSSFKKFSTSTNWDRVRNTFAANLINLRSSKDILGIGLESLIFLNCFMDLDLEYEVSESFILVPPQRFMMILNSLANLPDCDIAYDKEFNKMRIALLEFVNNYIKGVYYVCDSHYPSDFINKVFDLGMRLISETLNLVNSDEIINKELAYFTLKTFTVLNLHKETIETWDENINDIEDEIVELFFKASTIECMDQPTELFIQILSTIIEDFISLSKMKNKYEHLYILLKSSNIIIKRTIGSLLHKLIPLVQDDLVVEFALSKKKTNEEGVSDIHLPKQLLNAAQGGVLDILENLGECQVYEYLWSWILLMDHFKHITHQMRQDYISELGDDIIGDFMLLIFDELDVNKFSIHEDDVDYIKNYSFSDNKILEYKEEIKKILVNLLFDITNSVGGTFTQTWFQSIRNRQLKQSVEKFFTKYISPQLIDDIINNLSQQNNIEDDEFKVIINRKVNDIKCLYEIDDQKMEISISLPSNIPLEPITVVGISRIGVDEKKWKSWIMSAQYVINFQNGTIMDAIKHFKNNVKANFENYEDCAICYSILHAVDHSTPNKRCTTCKNNFHSACLYRWFKSSGSSTCPLCRSKFQFKKHS